MRRDESGEALLLLSRTSRNPERWESTSKNLLIRVIFSSLPAGELGTNPVKVSDQRPFHSLQTSFPDWQGEQVSPVLLLLTVIIPAS